MTNINAKNGVTVHRAVTVGWIRVPVCEVTKDPRERSSTHRYTKTRSPMTCEACCSLAPAHMTRDSLMIRLGGLFRLLRSFIACNPLGHYFLHRDTDRDVDRAIDCASCELRVWKDARR